MISSVWDSRSFFDLSFLRPQTNRESQEDQTMFKDLRAGNFRRKGLLRSSVVARVVRDAVDGEIIDRGRSFVDLSQKSYLLLKKG